MDMACVRCLFAARSRFNGEALPVLRGLSGMALSRGSRRHAEASSGNVQEDVGNGVKGLLFGLICRLRARACQGAAEFLHPSFDEHRRSRDPKASPQDVRAEAPVKIWRMQAPLVRDQRKQPPSHHGGKLPERSQQQPWFHRLALAPIIIAQIGWIQTPRILA